MAINNQLAVNRLTQNWMRPATAWKRLLILRLKVSQALRRRSWGVDVVIVSVNSYYLICAS